MSLLVFHTSRFRTRGTPRRSTRTCSLSWVWWGRKQRERWTNWERTWGSLIALWATRHREHFTCFHWNFKVFSVKFHPQEIYFPFIRADVLFNKSRLSDPSPFFFSLQFLKERENVLCRVFRLSEHFWHWVCNLHRSLLKRSCETASFFLRIYKILS